MKASLLALGMKRILSRLGDQLVNEGMQPLPACGATGLPVFGLGCGFNQNKRPPNFGSLRCSAHLRRVRSVQMHQPIGAATKDDNGWHGPKYKYWHCRLLTQLTNCPTWKLARRTPFRGTQTKHLWGDEILSARAGTIFLM
jgi:hypothetical protein